MGAPPEASFEHRVLPEDFDLWNALGFLIGAQPRADEGVFRFCEPCRRFYGRHLFGIEKRGAKKCGGEDKRLNGFHGIAMFWIVSGSIPRGIIRCFRDQPEPRAKCAQRLAPDRSRATDAQDFAVGFLHEPGVLREFGLELALAPSGISDECAHDCAVLVERGARFFQDEVVLAFHLFAHRLPSEGRKDELVGSNRAADEHGNPAERAEFLIRQNVRHRAARRAVQHDAERAFLGVVGGKEENRFAKVRVQETRVRDQERAGEAE